MSLPAAFVSAINRASPADLRAFVNCESCRIFAGLEISGEYLENGSGILIDACERRIAYLEQEEAGADLCFQRAEEYRRRGK